MTPGEDPGDVEGDRQGKLEEYCNWGLAQVESDRWRSAPADCESGCDRLVPRTKHYPTAPKGRR